MITFDELESGMEIIVSNGDIEPTDKTTEAWRAWHSNNFKGVVKEINHDNLLIGEDRGMCIVTWTLARSYGHTFTPVNPTDEQLHKLLYDQIDAQAAAQIPLSQAAYALKEEEARQWLSNPEESFPLLNKEAEVRGVSTKELVDMILDKANAHKTLIEEIEITRISAKLEVSKAVGEQAKREAAQVSWPN